MVYRVAKDSDGVLATQIIEQLSQEHPELANLLQAGVSPYNATLNLLGKGVLGENELLNLYNQKFELEEFDEEAFNVPAAFPEILPDYLLNFGLLPYQWDEKKMRLLAASPFELFIHAQEFKLFWNLELEFAFARNSFIERMINQIYKSDSTDSNEANNQDEYQLR
ncbi:MAG: hypothetical protein RR060_05290, partial [Victivallaceae bacterium]